MENQLLSMAQQFSGLPMEDLIGGPLNAAAKANAAMALTQTRFLMETCFNKEEYTVKIGNENVKRYKYNPIMIEMSLERGVLSQKQINNGTEWAVDTVTTRFNLPLLTIIPINSLGVSSVDKIYFER